MEKKSVVDLSKKSHAEIPTEFLAVLEESLKLLKKYLKKFHNESMEELLRESLKEVSKEIHGKLLKEAPKKFFKNENF